MAGRPFHVIGAGCVLTRRGGRLVVLRDGVLRASAPLALIGEVVVTGNVGITTAALHSLLAHDVPLILLSGAGRALGRLESPASPHIAVRARQLDLHRDPATRLGLGRSIVAAKVHNQGVLLRRRARRCADPDAVWKVVGRLAELEQAVDSAGSVASLLGVEGAAAGAYFGAIRHLVIPGHGFARRDRASRDVGNMLINYCSALLRETVTSAVLAAGLDPYLSFLHTPSRGRVTLAFDLMEEWRPVLLEATVLSLLGLRAVTPEDVVDEEHLSKNATAAAVTRFHARLAARARGWPAVSKGSSYGDVVRRQALRLRAHLVDGVAYEPFRWR